MTKTRLTAMTLAFAGLCAIGAQAQTGSSSNGTPSGSTGSYGTSTGRQSSTVDQNTYGSAADMGKALNSSEKQFVNKAAQGNIAEVELANLAQQKSSSSQVKEFAKKIEQDHQKSQDQLKQHAQNWSVSLPTTPSADQTQEKSKLDNMSGAQFDKAYMNYMVQEHKKDVNEFQQKESQVTNPTLKTWISNTVPVLQQHLQLAEQTQAQLSGSSSNSSSSSSSSGYNR